MTLDEFRKQCYDLAVEYHVKYMAWLDHRGKFNEVDTVFRFEPEKPTIRISTEQMFDIIADIKFPEYVGRDFFYTGELTLHDTEPFFGVRVILDETQ